MASKKRAVKISDGEKARKFERFLHAGKPFNATFQRLPTKNQLLKSHLAVMKGQALHLIDRIGEVEALLFGKKKPVKQSKSAISGKFVSKAAAKDNPYTTYTTKIKKK